MPHKSSQAGRIDCIPFFSVVEGACCSFSSTNYRAPLQPPQRFQKAAFYWVFIQELHTLFWTPSRSTSMFLVETGWSVACFTEHRLENHSEPLKLHENRNFASENILHQFCYPVTFFLIQKFKAEVIQRCASVCFIRIMNGFNFFFFFPGILQDYEAYAKLEKLMECKEKDYAIYGDLADPLVALHEAIRWYSRYCTA